MKVTVVWETTTHWLVHADDKREREEKKKKKSNVSEAIFQCHFTVNCAAGGVLVGGAPYARRTWSMVLGTNGTSTNQPVQFKSIYQYMVPYMIEVVGTVLPPCTHSSWRRTKTRTQQDKTRTTKTNTIGRGDNNSTITSPTTTNNNNNKNNELGFSNKKNYDHTAKQTNNQSNKQKEKKPWASFCEIRGLVTPSRSMEG